MLLSNWVNLWIIVGIFFFLLYVGIIKESLIFWLFVFILFFVIVGICNKLIGIFNSKFGWFVVIKGIRRVFIK